MTVCATLFLIIIGLMHRHRKPALDQVQKIYQQLCSRTARATRMRKPSEGPTEYAESVGSVRPDLTDELRYLFGMYVRLRYERSPNENLIRKFKNAVRRFRPSRHAAQIPATELQAR